MNCQLRSSHSMKGLFAIVFALALCHLSPGAERPPEDRYAEMKANFEKNDFSRAAYLGEDLIKNGHLSPQLFQLMGHIRYREGDLGKAAVWYLRASLFPPPIPEVRQNIAHIHDRTGNVRFAANGFRDQFSSRLSRTQWAHLAITAGWIFIFTLTIYLLKVRSHGLRTLLMLVRVLALGVVTVAALGWYWHPSYEKIANLAVVTTPNAKAYTAATVTSGSVVALPPGSEIRRLEERGAWCYVEIPTEGEYRRGWVLAEWLTPFWPFDRGYLE